MFSKAIFHMTQLLIKFCEKTGRVFKITGTAGADDVYLIRYYVIRSQYFNFFVHQFLRSDRDDLHDHPWDFCTYLVSGAYTERKYNPMTGKIEDTRRINKLQGYSYKSKVIGYDEMGHEIIEDYDNRHMNVRLNTFVTRKATDQHQVVVDKDLKEKDKAQAATTLFFSGRTKREWGFVKEVEEVVQVPKGFVTVPELKKVRKWILWTDYLGLPKSTKSRG